MDSMQKQLAVVIQQKPIMLLYLDAVIGKINCDYWINKGVDLQLYYHVAELFRLSYILLS